MEYALTTEGTHTAEIVSIKDRGSYQRPILITWLMLDQKDEWGKRVTLGEFFPKDSTAGSWLRKRLDSLGVRPGAVTVAALQALIGTTAKIVVEHHGTFANVKTIVPGSVVILTTEGQAQRAIDNAESSRKGQQHVAAIEDDPDWLRA